MFRLQSLWAFTFGGVVAPPIFSLFYKILIYVKFFEDGLSLCEMCEVIFIPLSFGDDIMT